MKKMIALVFAGLLLVAAIPALAEPSGEASPKAVTAQAVNECRMMMRDCVKAGEMTKDQLKACVEMMKTNSCKGGMCK